MVIGMKARLFFPPSASPDVVGYRLYMEIFPKKVTFNSTNWILDWELGPEENTIIAEFPLDISTNGIYNFGISAIDDAGNESAMSEISNVSLTFGDEPVDDPVVIPPINNDDGSNKGLIIGIGIAVLIGFAIWFFMKVN